MSYEVTMKISYMKSQKVLFLLYLNVKGINKKKIVTEISRDASIK